MAWKPLTSSNLHSYDYDDAQRILHVKFKSGGVFSYRNVEPDVAAGLETASSPGRYFHENVKGQYPYV